MGTFNDPTSSDLKLPMYPSRMTKDKEDFTV